MKIDYKRNNKISLRNFNERVDFHDVVKTLLVRMLRRSHPGNKCQIYTEFNKEDVNENYPDIQVIIQNKTQEIYIYELQESYTDKWLKKQQQKFEHVNLFIPIPLKLLRREWIKMLNNNSDPLTQLKKLLKNYII